MRPIASRLALAASASFLTLTFVACCCPPLPGPGAGVKATGSSPPDEGRKRNPLEAPTEPKAPRVTAAAPPSQVIGKWDGPELFFGGIVVFTKERGRLYMTTTFKDGGEERVELAVKKVGGIELYHKQGDESEGYLLIDQNGDLARVDKIGQTFAVAKKIK